MFETFPALSSTQESRVVLLNMKMKVLSVALVVCLLLAVACAEDYITRDFVQPKEGNELRIIGGHSVKDPNPYPWLVVVSDRLSSSLVQIYDKLTDSLIL